MPPCTGSNSSSDQTQTLTLIPGLPNDTAALILAHIPFPYHARLKPTSKSWKIFFSHKTLIPFRKLHKTLTHLLLIFPQDPSVSNPYIFHPGSLSWCVIPQMPCNPHVYGLSNFGAVCVGTKVFVIGGSLFDTRSFPIDRPLATNTGFVFDFVSFTWGEIKPMLSARGSFACAVVPREHPLRTSAYVTGSGDQIVVAGGGSRHTMFGAAGSRMGDVEVYDVARDEWAAVDGMPRFRAGCVGFLMEREFWVMGGYGESRTVSGVFPVDEYYRDALVMELGDGRVEGWREVGDMWEEGERRRLGKIVAVDNETGGGPEVFMLDGGDILRYDMDLNCWWKETSLPRGSSDDSSVGFIALNGELHAMTLLDAFDIPETIRPRPPRKATSLLIQIYHPRKKVWRSLISKPPLHHQLDFKTAVMCTIQL